MNLLYLHFTTKSGKKHTKLSMNNMSPERLRSVSGVPLLLSHQVQRQPTLFLHVLGKRQMILSVDLIQLNRNRKNGPEIGTQL